MAEKSRAALVKAGHHSSARQGNFGPARLFEDARSKSFPDATIHGSTRAQGVHPSIIQRAAEIENVGSLEFKKSRGALRQPIGRLIGRNSRHRIRTHQKRPIVVYLGGAASDRANASNSGSRVGKWFSDSWGRIIWRHWCWTRLFACRAP